MRVKRRGYVAGSAAVMRRRDFLATLSSSFAAAALPAGLTMAAQERLLYPVDNARDLRRKAPIRTVALNHVGLTCADVERSREFYQRLFGLPLQAQQGSSACLRLGEGPAFLLLARAGGTREPGTLDHWGMTVEDFDPDRIVRTLKGLGVVGVERRDRRKSEGGSGQATPEVFFTDPDGIPVQLQHATYAGGTGVRGNVTRRVPGAATAPPLTVRNINHVTLAVTDRERSVAFYQNVFGMPHLVARPVTGAPDLGIGTDPPFHGFLGILPGNAAAKPSISHVCLGVENFDAAAIAGILTGLGLKPGTGPLSFVSTRLKNDGEPGAPPGGSPEIFFRDPDNNFIQIQDVRFCGEADAVNRRCPN